MFIRMQPSTAKASCSRLFGYIRAVRDGYSRACGKNLGTGEQPALQLCWCRLVMLMIIGVGVLRQYAFAAASSLQARSHAEAVAVLTWKATEAQSATDCSSISRLSPR